MLLHVQESSRGSGSIQKPQDRSSSSPATLRREDVVVGDQAAGTRPRAVTSEVYSAMLQPSSVPLHCSVWCARLKQQALDSNAEMCDTGR